jgi:glycosyltransferase involved in cell wall biosynthesis
LALLKAFEQIGAELPDAHLLLVGEGGSDEPRVRRAAAESRFSKRIHVAGFQSDTRVFYHAMDMLAAPSPKEGLSNVVLEAMSIGIAVLAHVACGNREAVTNGYDGIIGEIDAPDRLAAQIRGLLPYPELRAALGAAARATILKRFRVERMVDDYARLYREIAGVSQAAPTLSADMVGRARGVVSFSGSAGARPWSEVCVQVTRG